MARTHGIFVDRGTYYLAMEYVAGGLMGWSIHKRPVLAAAALGRVVAGRMLPQWR